MIHIALADDHHIVRQGFKALLEAENQVLKKQLPSHLKALFGRAK